MTPPGWLRPDPDPAVTAAIGRVDTEVVPEAPLPSIEVEHATIQRGQTFSEAMEAAGFEPVQATALVSAARPHANLARVRPGNTFAVWRRADGAGSRLASFQMSLAPNRTLIARPRGESFEVEVREIPYETTIAGYQGSVDTTLWEAAVEAGIDPNLVADLADIFAFDLDFNTEVRRGDRFRLVVERKTLDGRPAGFGRILAAEYVNRGESRSAILFRLASGDAEYFAANGNSLRRMFLRSPLRYRRISSRFTRSRFHPVLKTRRPHHGVDYAADRGTPVRAVGDGVLTAANWNGGSGNFVKIRHSGVYETSYSHLQGYGPGIRRGRRVRQGQVIGYVGSTGLSSGPHLHFAFYERGRYVDPLSKRFPAADPVPKGERAAFEAERHRLLALLPAWPEAAALPMGPAILVPK